jgi:hypothetical protein
MSLWGTPSQFLDRGQRRPPVRVLLFANIAGAAEARERHATFAAAAGTKKPGACPAFRRFPDG